MSITPDKEDIYITIEHHRGTAATPCRDVQARGRPRWCRESELRAADPLKPGDVFSREQAAGESAKAISDRLGAEGYAFANVNAVPELDRDKRKVAFTFYVDPGRRVYVRKINISGNAQTRDEVIRREMRQLEGAWYDGRGSSRSKERVERLGYFDDVNVETPPVPGTTDQVDIEVNVTEKPTGNLLAASAIRRGRHRAQRRRLAAEHLRLGQRASACGQHERLNRTITRCRSPSRTTRSTA